MGWREVCRRGPLEPALKSSSVRPARVTGNVSTGAIQMERGRRPGQGMLEGRRVRRPVRKDLYVNNHRP